MEKNRKLLIGMVTGALLLSACGNDTENSSAKVDNQSENQQSAQSTNENSVTTGSTENAANADSTSSENADTEENESNEKADENSDSKKEENATTKSDESLKEEYLEKLNQATKELEESKDQLKDDTTYGMKKMEGERFEVLDGLLNEIYGVLEEQLPADEMEELRKEQREWIDYRDKKAKEASLKYEGGTMEQLEYVAVQNDLTEKRCYELVENYM